MDLNRAGVGLIELVSEPEIKSAQEAVIFVNRVHELLQDLGVCSGNMEQGVMRIDVNVNLIDPETDEAVTARVELKNINGINSIESALSTEIKRQQQLLLLGSTVRQETRLYCPDTDSTVLLRVKDGAETYRYLPEYDLPSYSSTVVQESNVPSSRHDKIKIFQNTHNVLENNSDLLLRLWTRPECLPSLFEHCLPFVTDVRFLLNWCTGELLAILNREECDKVPFAATTFADLVEGVRAGVIDKELAKSEMIASIKESRDLNPGSIKTITNANLSKIYAAIDSLFSKHSDRIHFLKSVEGGQRGSVDFFIGPLMKQFRGEITAKELAKMLKECLK